jgi:hypothetical protein
MTAIGRDFRGFQWLYRYAAVVLALIGGVTGFAVGGVEAASVLALVGYFSGKTAHSLGWVFTDSG